MGVVAALAIALLPLHQAADAQVGSDRCFTIPESGIRQMVPTPNVDDLSRRRAAFADALGARDADQVAGFFAQEAILQTAGRPQVEGRGAIRTFYEGVFGFLTESSLTPERIERSASGDMAWESGSSANAFRRPDGEVRFRGRYLMVWVRIEGEWFITAYALSSEESS